MINCKDVLVVSQQHSNSTNNEKRTKKREGAKKRNGWEHIQHYFSFVCHRKIQNIHDVKKSVCMWCVFML